LILLKNYDMAYHSDYHHFTDFHSDIEEKISTTGDMNYYPSRNYKLTKS